MIDFKKLSHPDRMAFVCAMLESIYEDMYNGQVDPEILQDAVYAQIFVNRIVFDLNEAKEKNDALL